jgi:hypothetical protein
MKFCDRAKPVNDPRPPRIVMAEIIRQLASGTITNDQFEDRCPKSTEDDCAIGELYNICYSLFDEMHEHKMRGRYRLSKFQREVLARCVLFLHTDIEYEWDKKAKWLWVRPNQRSGYFDQIVFTSISKKARNLQKRLLREEDKLAKQELIDDRIWPFHSRRDYKEALKHPVYLAGTA